MITLVLGGARSGKSALAERLVAERSDGGPVTYLATGRATDADMARRIEAHRLRRPEDWATVEVGAELPEALRRCEGLALLDALGTWVAGRAAFDVPTPALRDALQQRRGDTVVVSEEVGLGVHPSTELGRRFRDVLGTVNVSVAEVADEVLLVVAGRVLPLERR